MGCRLLAYLVGLILWPMVLVVALLLYSGFNAVAWRVGLGETLTSPPLAGIHHRIMYVATLNNRRLEYLDLTIQSSRFSMETLPTAEGRDRARFVYETAKHQQTLLWRKILAGALIAYVTLIILPAEIGAWIWRWRDRRCRGRSLLT